MDTIYEKVLFKSTALFTIKLNSRMDRILLETVIMEDFGSVIDKRDRLGEFLAKLTNFNKPVGYSAQHIKNLAFFGAFSQTDMINRVLGICCAGGSIENLVLLITYESVRFNLLDNPLVGWNLRRMTVQLDTLFPSGSESTPNFHHPCFGNLTHLHLYDKAEKWPSYAGWETLTNLMHLAFAHANPKKTLRLIQTTLRNVRYVMIGRYEASELLRYSAAVVDDGAVLRAGWGERFGNVIFL